MSFQENESDVSRLNLRALREPVDIDHRTMHVLARALEFSERSGGAFDVTVAGALVAAGRLPAPGGGGGGGGGDALDPAASWRDVELDGDRVRFHRPLWIDLSGIAKGYAVDQAMEAMSLEPNIGATVNAGGDLRIAGPDEEFVLLRVSPGEGDEPAVRLQDGSLASSSGRLRDRQSAPGQGAAPDASTHIDGRTRLAMGQHSFVCVAAQRCLTADALTKVVMACGSDSDAVLRRYDAGAWLYSEASGWRSLGLAA